MTQQEFERKVIKLVSVNVITYVKRFINKKLIISEVFVYFGEPSRCILSTTDKPLEDMIRQLERGEIK